MPDSEAQVALREQLYRGFQVLGEEYHLPDFAEQQNLAAWGTLTPEKIEDILARARAALARTTPQE